MMKCTATAEIVRLFQIPLHPYLNPRGFKPDLCDIHFPYFETNINILLAFVSNSISISIFWYPLFRIRDRYQYSGGLCFEFDININILMASVSNSISISIFRSPLFQIRYRYRNQFLMVLISILVSISDFNQYWFDIDTISIFWPIFIK